MEIEYADEIPLSDVKVTRVCETCAYIARWDKSIPRLSVSDPPLVSPTGLVHHGTDYGMTACGKDATGPKWWWRL